MTPGFRFSKWFYPVLMLLMVYSPARSAPVQEETQSPPPPYITIGQVEGSPGATLIVPVYYKPDPDKPVRSFTVDIEFVSNNLEFQNASNGIVDQEGLELSSAVTKANPDAAGVSRSKLRLTVALKGKNSNEGLAEGLLSYLMFQLSLQAKPFVIKLIPTIISAEDTQEPAKKVSNLSAQPGSISVLSLDVTPEMSCFFFSH
jgi:hypothetical protein